MNNYESIAEDVAVDDKIFDSSAYGAFAPVLESKEEDSTEKMNHWQQEMIWHKKIMKRIVRKKMNHL